MTPYCCGNFNWTKAFLPEEELAWFDQEQPERGRIRVKLKERYKNKLEQVMQSVATLSFVTDVEKIGVIRIPETF